MAGITPKGPRKPQTTNWRQVVDDYKQKIDVASAIRVPSPEAEGAVADKSSMGDEHLDAMGAPVVAVKAPDEPDLKLLEQALLSDHGQAASRNGASPNGTRTSVTPWYQLNRKRFDEGSAADQDVARYRSEDAMVSPVSLRKFQDPADRNHLDGIAHLVLTLTYGEMIELADGIWKAQPDGAVITQDNLPALLHRWSKGHAAASTKGGESSAA